MLGRRLGPYRIEAELGTGGMGRVYRAVLTEDTTFASEGETVALKVVHPHLLASPGFFKRFLREGELGRSVNHPNVVRTYDADALAVADQQVHFLVMEYVEGQTLRQLLDQLGRVGEELCRHIAREVAGGLVAIHEKGAIHRDLKPENVLITADHVVKIMDLGVARVAEETLRISGPEDFAGTPLYAAPEQVSRKKVDCRADLFSLGVILYELSTGRHPHPGLDWMEVLAKLVDEEPRRAGEIEPNLTPFFEELVHTLLKKDREDRFASAEELFDVIERDETSTWWADRLKAGREESRQMFRRLRLPRETEVHGRDRDLERLQGIYRSVLGGNGAVVLLEGEAGLGKSRLVDELVRQLREEGEELNFLFGAYPPGGAATALGAWSSAYLEHFGTEGLDQTLMRYLRITPLLVPAFAAMLRAEPAPKEAERLTMDSLQAAFVHATRALAEEHPTVLLIDDLQFAPSEGLSFFSSLVPALRDHPVLMIGTSWPGLDKNWWANLERLPQVTSMKLNRLTPEAVEALLTEALQSPATVAELTHRVAHESAGNPLFVFEILRALKEAGDLLPARGGRWIVKGRVEEITIPSTVVRLVKARLAVLDEDDRSLLEVAACCGVEFNPVTLADALELPRIRVLRDLARIERVSGLIRSRGRQFTFDHPHVRDRLYEKLPEALRSEYHAILGAALERVRAKGDLPCGAALATDICGHFLKSGEPARAAPHLVPALDHLEGTYQPERALELLRLALEFDFITGIERLDLLTRAAAILDLRGRYEQLEDVLTEALDLAGKLGDLSRQANLRGKMARLLDALGRGKEAWPLFLSAVRDAEASGDAEALIKTLLHLGSHQDRVGQPEEARVNYERALEIAEQAGFMPGVAAATGNLGLLDWQQGQPVQARAAYERALEIFRELGDRRAESTLTGLLGFLLDDQGLFREAAAMHSRQLTINRDIGYRRGVAIASCNLGDSLRLLGHLNEARHHFAENERICEELGDQEGVAGCLVNIAAIHRQLGENDEARRYLRRAVRLSRGVSARATEGLALYHLGGVEHRRGHPLRARVLGEKAVDILSEVQSRTSLAWAHLARGTHLLDEGKTNQAQARLREALRMGEETGTPQLRALSSCQLALAGEEDPEQVAVQLIELESRLEPHERIDAWFALWKAGGNPDHLARARDQLRRFIALMSPAEQETLLNGVANYREIHDAVG
jgi:tetratricopeptide (TPR) repeat protein